MRDKIMKYREAIFKMADSMASREGPVSDPDNVRLYSETLRDIAEDIGDSMFTGSVEASISERRFDAGMEAE